MLAENGPESGGPRSRIALLAVLFVWAVAVSSGFVLMTRYAQAEGRVAGPPPAGELALPIASEGYTLVMAVHPRCPCTKASLYELERLLPRAGGQLTCVFVVLAPADRPDDWHGEARARLRSRGLGGTVIVDPGGEMAARLGCFTSGSVVLYDRVGTPLFWGGVTSGRGHAGDNAGTDAIRAILVGRTPAHRTTPVFGCPLHAVRGASECVGECGVNR